MKYIFLGVLAALILASFATHASLPQQTHGKPVVYWVTDPNPVRQSQVDAFHAWMQEHVPAEDHYVLQIDAANASPQKKIIQSVSGVGGDIMDTGADSGEMQYFRQMGIICDLTDDAERLGFQADLTYDAIKPLLLHQGRQYMFPCNVFLNMFWVNKTALKQHGLTMPSPDWTFDDYEREAIRFSELANQGLEHPRYFYANRMDHLMLMRNLGLDIMNETMSATAVDDQRLVDTFKRLHRWTYDLHILPTTADLQSISTESAHGGSGPQMFRTGNYALYMSGRWALCQFRQWPDFKDLELGCLPPPDGGFQNTSAGSRAAVMYAGSKNKRLAAYFFQFLASEDYSQTIVESADALPPRPSSADSQAYRKPAAYPNEWGVHEAFSEGFKRYGMAVTPSPFISNKITLRELNDAKEAVMAMPSLRTAEEAAARCQERINARIQLNLVENPGLKPDYDEAIARQQQIDALKAAGKKIPASLISNDYYIRYYRAMGMLLDDADEEAAE